MGCWARGKHEGRARREGVRETPARKSLFSTSRLLIMYAKITQAVNDELSNKSGRDEICPSLHAVEKNAKNYNFC